MVTETDRRIDEYLVVCARLGNRRAFGRLAVRWQKKLLVHAWRLLGDESESAAQAPARSPDFAGGDFERVRREVRALPAQRQAAVALYYFEELTVAEVAVAPARDDAAPAVRHAQEHDVAGGSRGSRAT